MWLSTVVLSGGLTRKSRSVTVELRSIWKPAATSPIVSGSFLPQPIPPSFSKSCENFFKINCHNVICSLLPGSLFFPLFLSSLSSIKANLTISLYHVGRMCVRVYVYICVCVGGDTRERYWSGCRRRVMFSLSSFCSIFSPSRKGLYFIKHGPCLSPSPTERQRNVGEGERNEGRRVGGKRKTGKGRRERER